MINIRFILFISILFVFACKSPNGNTANNSQTVDHQGRPTNHLAKESSPYLLQHMYNPVDWYPWNDEALEKAKKEDKMLLISVGYSACHWCHVMEHESFEDSLVAKVMNENFVCIKVDREERPDVDDVYMTACHMATGKSCGWPLNAFALPDGRPVWAGTYFPKKNWLEILEYFIKLRADEPEKLEEYAVQLTEGLQSSEGININTGDQNFNRSELDDIASKFLKNIDFKDGGRKGAPKFPMPNNYQFLLAYHHLSGNSKALEAVNTTLEKMALGGIYDQIGGGFARYSTDGIWLAPHFEKMLYDNGQLVSLYSDAFALSKNPLYEKTVRQTLDFIKRELTDKSGGFYSSLDADSEGEEGKFYVWTKEEIDAVLTDEKVNKAFCDYYEVKSKGNWEHKKNILHRKASSKSIAKKQGLTEEELAKIIKGAEEKLFTARSKRIRPGLDDKVLTSWNALMLKGYVHAYKAFGDEEYLNTAIANANFITVKMMQSDSRLNRNYKNGKSVINGFLDDYALTIDAFTSLYQATLDEQWLTKAKGLTDYAIAHFQNTENGMFNYTSDLDPPLIARKMELADNVIPGSNSAMARSLFGLGTYMYNTAYTDKAKEMMHNISETLSTSDQPNFYSNWCSLYLSLTQPPYEVAIIGNDYAPLHKEMLSHYLPNALLLGGKTEGGLELLKNKLQEGETMIYVCQNKVCKFPVQEVNKALELMK